MLAVTAVASLALVAPVAAHAGTAGAKAVGTARVSVATDGTQGNEHSFISRTSADGRYIVYSSAATNLAPDGRQWAYDIISYDRVEKTSTRVAISDDGDFNGSGPADLSISADGRYVAFDSIDRLLPDQTKAQSNVYVWDRTTGKFARISNTPEGQLPKRGSAAPEISADGRYIAYSSLSPDLVPGDFNQQQDVFVYDQHTKTTERVSVDPKGKSADGASGGPTLSADGRYVTFQSRATDLVPGDTNGALDVFLYDRTTKRTTLISALADGTQGNGWSYTPRINATGRYIAYRTDATNLVPGDTNGVADVVLYDRKTKQTTRVSVAAGGGQLDKAAYNPVLTANGRLIAYMSEATNVVSGDTNGVTDVFVHDVKTGRTERVSVAADGAQGNGASQLPWISANGKFVSYQSDATNLVPGDTNEKADIFLSPARRTPAG
jgi:Tol biopolymer transport system component